MKFLPELREMVEQMAERSEGGDPLANRAINITGDNCTVIIYAQAPVTVHACGESQQSRGTSGEPRRPPDRGV